MTSTASLRVAPGTVAAPRPTRARRAADAARTVGALGLLSLALPLNAAVSTVALGYAAVVPLRRAQAARPRTVLVSGGKMTKSLHLARAFHQAGHRVVMVESAKYRWTGHRFSRAVDVFRTVPDARSPDYAAALAAVVRAEGVDVYVPVCSPAASYHDAAAKTALEGLCEVVHLDPDVVATLDDKHTFAELAASLGLPVPDSHLVTGPDEVEGALDRAREAGRGPYVLKSIAYDPVHRLDLTPLPRPTAGETAAFAAARPIRPDNPWLLQELVTGAEFCAHATARNGVVQVYACSPSSAFQVNYASVDEPAIETWVRRFVGALGLTGQVSFDFLADADGQVLAIECNPRTHSAITMLDDPVALARAYLEDDVSVVRPRPASRPTYWLYHEAWRLLAEPNRRQRLRTVLEGRDAVFAWSDPLPFLLEHHLQIPLLLLSSLHRGKGWLRIDFNIGKLVEADGD
ncbi:ATP-grasp domain-containing protein [Microlunatus flavus]|uniref:Predicted ATP-dependent carboligase, ATP-grasp superfamily n=1 Tax=Microlunatus flavus TaxID=1036181 RepID=A0A1H9ETG4_9ACTN|nr:hypothetical protein [Microlunatus flavus]SEQ28877.1 Predicted ATP-dependent carboligase, ATP-grasp superfamily [Microlunatus flavus]